MTRRKLLFTGLASAAAAAYPIAIEPGWLELTHTQVRLGGPARGALRILQLTDLHASFEVPTSFIASAIEIGLAARPDVICLTGDYVTYGLDFDEKSYVPVLRRLSAATPVFAVMGNHDGGYWARKRGGPASHTRVARMLEDAGIQVLHNRSRVLEVRGREFLLAGLGDLWSHDIRPEAALKGAGDAVPVVVMCHNPDGKELVQRLRWDLMLCGHTHGGQVVIPFEGPPYTPVRDKRFIAGLRPWEGRQIYVSRGVGSIRHVRFLCRPEVTIVDVVTG